MTLKKEYQTVYTLGDWLEDKKTKECWVVVASYCQPSIFDSNFELKKGKFKFKLLKEPKSLDIRCYYLLSMKGNGMKVIQAIDPHPSKKYRHIRWNLKKAKEYYSIEDIEKIFESINPDIFNINTEKLDKMSIAYAGIKYFINLLKDKRITKRILK